MNNTVRYSLFGIFSLAGIITIWSYHGIDAGIITLFVWASGFILGAAYRRGHP